MVYVKSHARRCWLATALTWLPEKQTRGRHRQKLHADSYVRMLHLPMEQIVGNIGRFLQLFDLEKLVGRGDEEVTKVEQARLKLYRYLDLESEQLRKNGAGSIT